MKKILITLALFALTMPAFAQWSIGLRDGVNLNHMTRSSFYTDATYINNFGISSAITVSYKALDWLTITAEPGWTERNYITYHNNYYMQLAGCHESHQNGYLQLPIMADFNWGGEKLRFHLMAGVSCGYWLYSLTTGSVYALNIDPSATDEVVSSQAFEAVDVEFDEVRDNRFCFGYVAGMGLSFNFNEHWGLLLEGLVNYDVTSQTKDYMRINDPRYNTTYTLKLGLNYSF